jgi:WD40 repeat protein
MPDLLRIFISSPADVAPERRRAALVIEKLAKDYARFFEIKPYLWETEPMLASGHFQDAILPPGETDILALILWARLGTPLPAPKYRGMDGREPVTGTEWEFEAALVANQQSGIPDLLAYKKKASPKAEYRSDADLEELRNQLQKFDAFWSRHFVDRGEFRAAFGEFESLDEFEAKLEGDLRRLIERRIVALTGKSETAASPTWLKGSPFRGLETYRFEHAPIFFGRSEATKTSVEHLVENAEAGRPFLLVLGASGSGKSSLAQAGIVPSLGVRGVVDGVGEWRRAVVRPGGHPGGPFMALAAALTDSAALPELLTGQAVGALAKHLEVAAADPSFPIVAALTAREQAARQQGELLSFEQLRLILVVDQLEELFTLGEVTPDQRKAFILCLKGLFDSRRVFVIATMRSDYWHRAAEMPLLVALAEGQGRLDLLSPTQAEITEMIRRPAEVAGLSFETDPRTEIRLDAALAEEAAREPGALPLLSFLLDALYAADVQDNPGSTLRYASMRALGGLKGAIANRAEATFTSMPADAQAALPKVLRALVTVSRSGAEPTARPVPMAQFAENSPERRVVETLLDPQVRLLVVDGDGAGARVRLAHEALITHWERARRQIAQDRDDLRTRTVVEEAMAEWRAADGRNKRGYLLRDPYLAAAVDIVKRWGDELDSSLRLFIQASYRRARLLQQLTVAIAAVFAMVAVLAAVSSLTAYRAQREAVTQRNFALQAQETAQQKSAEAITQRNLALQARELAQQKSAEAIEQRDRAFKTQSRLLLEKASRLTEQGETQDAILVALEAFRNPEEGGPELHDAAAEKSLADAIYRYPLQGILAHETVKTVHAALAFDDSLIVTVSANGTASIWNRANDGRYTKAADLPEKIGSIKAVIANPKKPILLFARTDSTFFAWDYQAQAAVKGIEGSCDEFKDGDPTQIDDHFKFDPSGSRLFAFCGSVRIFDTSNGRLISRPGPFELFAMAGNGQRFVTAKREGNLIESWNAVTGDKIKSWKDDDFAHQTIALSLDGDVALVGHRYSVQFWKASTGARLGAELQSGQSRTDGMIASPFDDLFATSGDDGTHLWSVERRASIQNSDAAVKAFLPNRMSITQSITGDITLWRYAVEGHMGTSQPRIQSVISKNEDQNYLAANASGTRIITLGDGDVYVWKVNPPMLIEAANVEAIDAINLSGDGKTIAAAPFVGEDYTDPVVFRFFDVDGLKERQRFSFNPRTVNATRFDYNGKLLQLNEDGKRLLLSTAAAKQKSGTGTDAGNAFEVFDVPGSQRIFPAKDEIVSGKGSDISFDGETIAVVGGSYLDFYSIANKDRIKRCKIADAALISVSLNEKADRAAVADETGNTWSVERDTCKAITVIPTSDDEGNEFGLRYRNGTITRWSAWQDDESKKYWIRIRIWSDEKQSVVLDRKKPEAGAVEQVGFYSAKGQEATPLVAETIGGLGGNEFDGSSDGFVRLYDLLTDKNRVEFRYDLSAEGCESNLVRFLSNPQRLLTACRERGESRLRTWRIFSSADELLGFAKEIVPGCLSLDERRGFGLDDQPPRWCIEMGKSPYNKAASENTAPESVNPKK